MTMFGSAWTHYLKLVGIRAPQDPLLNYIDDVDQIDRVDLLILVGFKRAIESKVENNSYERYYQNYVYITVHQGHIDGRQKAPACTSAKEINADSLECSRAPDGQLKDFSRKYTNLGPCSQKEGWIQLQEDWRQILRRKRRLMGLHDILAVAPTMHLRVVPHKILTWRTMPHPAAKPEGCVASWCRVKIFLMMCPEAVLSTNKARQKADETRRELFVSWHRLKDIVLAHEQTIHKRWKKRTAVKRKQLLQEIDPELSKEHAPEIAALEQDQSGRQSRRSEFM
ncbi:hypothetical protein B0H17DRAFT_1155104 [Mycena rosella]|uniref:Uncharacterized protein n=1 Tax=Mycena rosella TaxID=1033263 RepID=A0AAD7F7Q5_MYCRO|nr:hypothetical protein B0H17DRAFT_1155104 [Mycena rosella]